MGWRYSVAYIGKAMTAVQETTDSLSTGEVFRHHADYARRLLRRLGVAERDVADACQDVFLVVFRKLPEFEGRASVRTWLYRICLRVAADYRKRAYRRYELLGCVPAEPRAAAEQTERQEAREAARHVERALLRGSAECHAVFVLYELEELPMAEVAALLGCPLKTAFSRLYTARRNVRSALRRAGLAGFVWGALGQAPTLARAQPALREVFGQLGAGAPATAGLAATTGGASVLAIGAGAKVIASVLAGAAAALLVTTGALVAPQAVIGATLVPQDPVPAQIAGGIAPRYQHRPSVREFEPEVPLADPSPAPRARRPASPVPVPAPRPAAEPAREPEAWIFAPPRTARAVPAKPSPTPRVGLDEVLSATDVRSLMRVGPGAPREGDVVLVP